MKPKHLMTFGGGKHCVEFKWKDVDNIEKTVRYRTNSRRGVSRILCRFSRALKALKQYIKTVSIAAIQASSVEYGYTWLSCKCPYISIKTTKKDGTEYKRSFGVHYGFNGTLTIENIRRRILGASDNHN